VARRLSFGVALALIAVATVGNSLAWVLGDEVPGWVAPAATIGGAAFVLGVTLALKDLLRGAWSAARERKSQITKLGELTSAVGELRREAAERDSTISLQTAAIWKSIDKLERVQVDDVGAALGRIERVQVDDVGAALGRIERVQVEDVGAALGRIERVQVEDVYKALKEIQSEQDAGYRQIESHVTLMTAMNLRAPLPPMRRTWAIAPDSAAFLVQVILEHDVRSVLEAGSGLSTVLVAQALKMMGRNQFTSLEQDPIFLARTLALLRSEGLEDNVNLVEAPLKDTIVRESVWQWYDENALEGLLGLDLVIVDGPPSRTGNLARYPALPMLAKNLNEGALIFLDDARREDEVEIVNRWIDEFPVIALDAPKLENGVALLQWRP
jgi:predicted O-methyltransferase YrrM